MSEKVGLALIVLALVVIAIIVFAVWLGSRAPLCECDDPDCGGCGPYAGDKR